MKEHAITLDVYASWSDKQPCYRIYVDGDLLAEHDFTWHGHEVYVREYVQVLLEPGEHNLRVEQVTTQGTIKVKNITVDGVTSAENFSTVE